MGKEVDNNDLYCLVGKDSVYYPSSPDQREGAIWCKGTVSDNNNVFKIQTVSQNKYVFYLNGRGACTVKYWRRKTYDARFRIECDPLNNPHIFVRDNLLTGTEHSVKISPDCTTPIKSLSMIIGKPSDEEKISIVLNDPKFGMFSLQKYFLTRGYKNEVLKRKNTFYCSHIFSSLALLPSLVFIAQWSIYIGLVAYEWKEFDGDFCPNKATWEKKLIMFASALIYYVRSFFLWDNLTDRTRLRKMIPSTNMLVMLDTFQEFGFNLFVYAANLWIIFVEDEVQVYILLCIVFLVFCEYN